MSEKIMLQDEYDFRLEKIARLEEKNRKLHGELSAPHSTENSDGEDGLNAELERNSQKIIELRGELKSASIVEAPVNPEDVCIGSKVSLILQHETLGNEEINVTIGGYNTPIEGRCSINAPLVAQIIGEEEGETAYITINGEEKNVTIQSVVSPEKSKNF